MIFLVLLLTGVAVWALVAVACLWLLYEIAKAFYRACSFARFMLEAQKIYPKKPMRIFSWRFARGFLSQWYQLLFYIPDCTRYTFEKGYWKDIGDWAVYPMVREEGK
jgi:hypothetical protein